MAPQTDYTGDQRSMELEDAIDMGREAILMTLMIGSPILVTGLVVGLTVGLLQALTQIQEQAVSFVPKIVAMILTLSLVLPWLVARMVEYTRELIVGIPERL